jgi:hypothetical protein
MNSSKPVYYISAHSEIPRKGHVSHTHIPKIPENTYLIMTTECGKVSYVTAENAFLKKWINSPEGIESLKSLINTGTHPLYVNGRLVYSPGNEGPINQVLDFIKNGKPEIFFLGVKKAPIQMRNLEGDYAKKIKDISREKLLEVYRKLADPKNTSKNWNHLNDYDEADLVDEIQSMMAKERNYNQYSKISYPQLYMAITDNAYFKEFILDKQTPFEQLFEGSKKISKILEEHGPGIYIIDACRVYGKIRPSGNYAKINPDESGILKKAIIVPLKPTPGQYQFIKNLHDLTNKQINHIKQRLANWEENLEPLRKKERR